MELTIDARTFGELAVASVAALVDGSRARPLSAPTCTSVAYIARHFDERVRLADLAAASGETPFRLIRAFRRDIGTTPHAFLVRVRVAVAAAMLTAGEPIAAIATAVGFVDQAHFTRHFKRLLGRTPARLRAAAGNRGPSDDGPHDERRASASAQSRGDGRFARLLAGDRQVDVLVSARPLAHERALRASATPRALAGPSPSAAALTRADATDGRYAAAAC